MVSQDVTLFNDSVAANIAYGDMIAASRDAVVAAAKAARDGACHDPCGDEECVSARDAALRVMDLEPALLLEDKP